MVSVRAAFVAAVCRDRRDIVAVRAITIPGAHGPRAPFSGVGVVFGAAAAQNAIVAQLKGLIGRAATQR
jgi:hypothetical protein